jgi:PAS domain S-box-containing protein
MSMSIPSTLLPANEKERLTALKSYQILDTPSEPAFDDLARLAAQLCGVPIGLIAFVDAERVWLKARFGLHAQEMAREKTVCAHAILEPGTFIVQDLSADPRFSQHPLVNSEEGLRFFAGTPLMSAGSLAVGALCVLDRAPRELRPEQLAALEILGRQVITQLELRQNLRRLQESIADHELAEAALRDSEVLYHSLVEHVPLNIFRKDTHGRFTFVNKLFCQTLGRPPEQIMGKTDADFFPPRLAAKYRRDDQLVMDTGRGFDEVEEHVKPTGEKIYVHVLKTPLQDAAGHIIGIQGIFWDETQRRTIEEALAHERDLLQALLDNVPDAIYFKDLQSRFLRCSRALAHKFGLADPSALLGKTDFDFFTVAHARPAYEDEQGIIRTGRPVENLTECETLPDGRVGYVLTSKLPFRNKQGEIIGTFGISKDITRLIETEQKLAAAAEVAQESARLKSEFLANMSHEIRTPMNAIIGMTELLLGTALSGEQREFVQTIRGSADTMLRLINDILDLSKLEARRTSLDMVDFDLLGSFEDTVDLLARSAHAKGLELNCWVDDDLPTMLKGDPHRLRQVLTNLLGNAIKFTERGEVVVTVIRVGEADDQLTIRCEVKDTGIGVAKDAQSRLFQSFTQADGSMTRKYGGTGLGLAIVKELVGLMRGQVGVESEPGVGSTFWFTATFGRSSEARVELPAAAGVLADKQVLVVDDHPTSRSLLCRQLRRWRLAPVEAARSAQALDLLLAAARSDRPFDVVLVDAQMPEMGGFTLVQSIRRDPRLVSCPLVMLTSLTAPQEMDRIRDVGVAQCLFKPVRRARLLEALARALRREEALPARDTPASKVGRTSGTTAPRALRVLVAEDNPVNQRLIALQLGKLGHFPEVVATGKEALEKLKETVYDGLLLDCQMPELDGYGTAKIIRQQETEVGNSEGKLRPRLWIIAMTAHSLEGDRERCLAGGMDDYISKPVRLEDLSAALGRIAGAPGLVSARASAVPEWPEGLDLSIVRGLRGLVEPGQPDPAAQMITLFLQSSERLLAEMRQALSRTDFVGLKASAHSLKGSSSNLGARRLASLCASLEKGALAADSAPAEEALACVETEFASVRKMLMAEAVQHPQELPPG